MRISVTDAKAQLTGHVRRAVLEAVGKSARSKAAPGASAARSQDFLYGANGLPE